MHTKSAGTGDGCWIIAVDSLEAGKFTALVTVHRVPEEMLMGIATMLMPIFEGRKGAIARLEECTQCRAGALVVSTRYDIEPAPARPPRGRELLN